jgi:hypothetical protein
MGDGNCPRLAPLSTPHDDLAENRFSSSRLSGVLPEQGTNAKGREVQGVAFFALAAAAAVWMNFAGSAPRMMYYPEIVNQFLSSFAARLIPMKCSLQRA